MTHRLLLFVTMCALAGFGGAVGSILGHAFGSRGLYVGGIGGGLLAVALGAWIAAWRRWIPRKRLVTTALGAGVGFLAAVAVAVNTLSSPVGPVLSTLLVGIGALLGSRGARGDADRESPRNQ
jgi:peptidoglycan/LPS O-acetylase OafA/YrhL